MPIEYESFGQVLEAQAVAAPDLMKDFPKVVLALRGMVIQKKNRELVVLERHCLHVIEPPPRLLTHPRRHSISHFVRENPRLP